MERKIDLKVTRHSDFTAGDLMGSETEFSQERICSKLRVPSFKNIGLFLSN